MKKGRAFLGTIFIILAIALILDKLGLLAFTKGFFQGIGWFKMLLAVLFAGSVVDSIISRNFEEILFPIAFLCIIFRKQLHLEAITPWPVLGAALLGTIGISLFDTKKDSALVKYQSMNKGDRMSSETIGGNEISYSIFLGNGVKYVTSTQLKKAKFGCKFGDMSVFFDKAQVEGSSVDVNVNLTAADLTLYIPKNWVVENAVRARLTDYIEEGEIVTDENTVTVNLTGKASCSDLTIIRA